MNKKENRIAVRQAAQQAVIRDEQNHRIQYAAANPVQEVLKSLHTTLRGLDEENISVNHWQSVWQRPLLILLQQFSFSWQWFQS